MGPSAAVFDDLRTGAPPGTDGWGWLYRAFDRLASPGSRLRRVVCRYFLPSRLESAGGGRIYRLLGVAAFGRIIPTGGIRIRRLTGARMAPYTLPATSCRAARDFYFKACAFETMHMPFFLVLMGITIDRALAGRLDLALEDAVVNLVVNLYPMLHHRHTRVRIVRLLSLAERARRARESGPAQVAQAPARPLTSR